MKKACWIFGILLFASAAFGTVAPTHFDSIVVTNASAIGTKSNPNTNALLDLVSSSQGLLLPRLTTTQVNAIGSPTEGLSVYNITDHKLTYYDGTAWREGTAGGLITNADVAAGAGIVYSKLNLTGGIVNADINNTAAIAYSKLALTGSILNADLAGSIADSKLLTISTAGKVSNSATTATDVNTASAIVARDASGNFTAGTITAAVTGTASGNTTITPANHGVVVSSGTNALGTVAVGSTGQYLQGVTGANPVWSTATLPSTATSTGTILRSDGTNWAATTATYPATVVNKNILYGTATNVVGQLNSTATSVLATTSLSVPSMVSGTTANRLLRTDGTTVTFGQAALATDVSGTLPIANGGTNNGSLSVTGGTVYYADGTKVVGLANGTVGQVLTSAGGTSAPTWSASSGGSSASGENIIKNFNPDFNNGTTNWTASGGTLAVAATTDILFDAGVTWDSNAAAQTLCSNLTAIPEGLKSTNGYASIWIKTPSGTATHLLQVSDGTNTLISTAITSSTTARKSYVNFPIPASGSVKLCLVSVASNEPQIDIGKAYVGEATNITSVSVVTDPVAYTPTFTGFGTVSAVNFTSWRDGPLLKIQGTFTSGTPTTTEARITLGYGGLSANVTSSSAIPTIQLVGKANRSTSSSSTNFSGMTALAEASKTYFTLGNETSSSSGLTKANADSILANGQNISVYAEIPIAGWTANTSAVAIEQTNYDWTSYTPTFTGFGTVSVSSCWHKRDAGDLLLRCKFTSGTSTATEARVSLPNSLTSAASDRIATLEIAGGDWLPDVSGTSHGGVTLMEQSKGYLTFSTLNTFSGVTGTPLAKANGNDMIASGTSVSFAARIPITGWTENNKAPVLIGSVTSGSTVAERIERAIINISGASACSITSQSGTWLTGCSAASTVATLTITTGYFSATPTCVGSRQSTGAPGIVEVVGTSSTQFLLTSYDTLSANQTGSYSVICMGPR